MKLFAILGVFAFFVVFFVSTMGGVVGIDNQQDGLANDNQYLTDQANILQLQNEKLKAQIAEQQKELAAKDQQILTLVGQNQQQAVDLKSAQDMFAAAQIALQNLQANNDQLTLQRDLALSELQKMDPSIQIAWPASPPASQPQQHSLVPDLSRTDPTQLNLEDMLLVGVTVLLIGLTLRQRILRESIEKVYIDEYLEVIYRPWSEE